MSLMSLPKMMVSDSEGWSDIRRIHPSVQKLMLYFVAPMSLLPPLMHAYSQLIYPGTVFPRLAPLLTMKEALAVGGAFFLIELATVVLMGYYIQQLAEAASVRTDYESAFTLAAIAPTPLWLASLMLFVPSLWANLTVAALAWVACVALIRHGVHPVFQLGDEPRARKLANAIVVLGVAAWIALMVVLVLLLGMLVGLR